jgi:hypothetical protein
MVVVRVVLLGERKVDWLVKQSVVYLDMRTGSKLVGKLARLLVERMVDLTVECLVE